ASRSVHSCRPFTGGAAGMGRYQPFTIMRSAALAAVAVAGIAAGASVAHADALLEEMVGFTGQVFFIDAKVPAVIIGAVRDGDVAVSGFGERAGPGAPVPDSDTIDALAHMTAKGTVALTDPLTKGSPTSGLA